MDYSSANGGLWNVFVYLGIIAGLLLLGSILNRKVAWIRNSLLPVSALAGFLLLVLRNLGWLHVPMDILEMITYHGIALGFIIDIPADQRSELPQWMIIDTVGELKSLFFQTIILYLVVHFAAQVGESETPPDWNALVLPASALLLSGAMKRRRR